MVYYSKISIFFLFIIIIWCSCTDIYEIDRGDGRNLVIEGQIVNKNTRACHSYIRVTKSKLGVSNDSIDLISVNDAIVIVGDNNGIIDTFRLEPEYYPFTWTDDEGNVHLDSSENINYQKGYYIANKLNPIENRTYYLTVKYNSKEYHANCFMPAVPKMDSVNFVKKQAYKGGTENIPILYFTDPSDVKNYYLFIGSSNTTYWNYSVQDDKSINPVVYGIDMFKGISNEYWMPSYPFNITYQFQVHSITKEAYDYYDVLSKLFVNDGGNYKPAPASPISNIDNNALGFFRASAVQILEAKPK